jgi:hypothetical protein
MYRSTLSSRRHWMEVSGELHAPAALPPWKEPPVPTEYDPRGGMDEVEKRKFLTPPRLDHRPLGHPARSQSLYHRAIPAALVLYIFFRKIMVLFRDALSPKTQKTSH